MAAKTREFSNHMVDEDPRGQGFKGLSRDHPRDSPPAEREASGCPPRRGALDLLGVQAFLLCPAPSIDAAGGISAGTCLTPPKGGGVSARADRRGDAQDKRDAGVFLTAS